MMNLFRTEARTKIAAGAVAAAIAAGSVIGVAAPAQAAENGKPDKVDRVETAMTFAGFDAAVAEANGYQVITDDAGNQTSVPVTPEAIKFEESLTGTTVTPYATVTGPCGKSWLNVESFGTRKVITTGYSVSHPVIAKLWIAQVYGGGGLPSQTWIGGGGYSWNVSWSFFYTGGGFANVTPGSNVVMNNGTVCVSGSPGENF